MKITECDRRMEGLPGDPLDPEMETAIEIGHTQTITFKLCIFI